MNKGVVIGDNKGRKQRLTRGDKTRRSTRNERPNRKG